MNINKTFHSILLIFNYKKAYLTKLDFKRLRALSTDLLRRSWSIQALLISGDINFESNKKKVLIM